MNPYEKAVDLACADLKRATMAYLAAPNDLQTEAKEEFDEYLAFFKICIAMTRGQKRMGVDPTLSAATLKYFESRVRT